MSDCRNGLTAPASPAPGYPLPAPGRGSIIGLPHPDEPALAVYNATAPAAARTALRACRRRDVPLRPTGGAGAVKPRTRALFVPKRLGIGWT